MPIRAVLAPISFHCPFRVRSAPFLLFLIHTRPCRMSRFVPVPLSGPTVTLELLTFLSCTKRSGLAPRCQIPYSIQTNVVHLESHSVMIRLTLSVPSACVSITCLSRSRCRDQLHRSLHEPRQNTKSIFAITSRSPRTCGIQLKCTLTMSKRGRLGTCRRSPLLLVLTVFVGQLLSVMKAMLCSRLFPPRSLMSLCIPHLSAYLTQTPRHNPHESTRTNGIPR